MNGSGRVAENINIINYFPHDSNARNDTKILNLRADLGAEGYGIYFMILERLRESADYMSVTDYNAIAFDLRVSSGQVKRVVEDFGLFSLTEDGTRFYSESFNNRMNIKDNKRKDISEARRKAANSKWDNENEIKSEKTQSQLRSERLAEARKKGTHTEKEWQEMKDFFGECVKCGIKTGIIRHHITPISKGGSDGIENLEPLCRRCSSGSNADEIDFREIWCDTHNKALPKKWVQTRPKEKESKGKETKVNESKEKESKHHHYMGGGGGVDASSDVDTGKFKKVIELYNYSGFQNINPSVKDTLLEFTSAYPYSWLEEAFKIATDGGKLSLNYVRGILNRWQTNGKDSTFKSSNKQKTDTERYYDQVDEWTESLKKELSENGY